MRLRQCPYHVPATLWLMTDERIAEERLIRAARRLPPGAGIVLRHYGLAAMERRALFERLRKIARKRHLSLFLAGPASDAMKWGADGSHGRSGDRTARTMPLSLSVHTMRELREARRRGASFVFLSPLFATRSHPGGAWLGPVRFSAIARQAHCPVMALGGVAPRHAGLVRMLGAQGLGAIDGLTRCRRAG